MLKQIIEKNRYLFDVSSVEIAKRISIIEKWKGCIHNISEHRQEVRNSTYSMYQVILDLKSFKNLLLTGSNNRTCYIPKRLLKLIHHTRDYYGYIYPKMNITSERSRTKLKHKNISPPKKYDLGNLTKLHNDFQEIYKHIVFDKSGGISLSKIRQSSILNILKESRIL